MTCRTFGLMVALLISAIGIPQPSVLAESDSDFWHQVDRDVESIRDFVTCGNPGPSGTCEGNHAAEQLLRQLSNSMVFYADRPALDDPAMEQAATSVVDGFRRFGSALNLYVNSMSGRVVMDSLVEMNAAIDNIDAAIEAANAAMAGGTGTDEVGPTTSIDAHLSLGDYPVTTGPPPAATACTVVELYPGYPGYQGFVTGLDGIGDHACLQDLEAAYPTFDRIRENAANIEAAHRLGLHGVPQDWTWETWMAIEAERGLPPTCYSCAIGSAPNRPEPSGTPIRPDDPRLRIGDMWGTVAVGILAVNRNMPVSSAQSTLPFDRDLRALVNMANPGRYLTAAEVADLYEQTADGLFVQGYGFDVSTLARTLETQGGYAPTPPTANVNDQIYMVMVGIEALSHWIVPMLQGTYINRFVVFADQWRADLLDGDAPSFAEWLRQHHAWDGM